jgi:hypothetical protein
MRRWPPRGNPRARISLCHRVIAVAAYVERECQIDDCHDGAACRFEHRRKSLMRETIATKSVRRMELCRARDVGNLRSVSNSQMSAG